VELKEVNKRKRWEEGGNFFKLAFHPGKELFFFSSLPYKRLYEICCITLFCFIDV